MVCALAGVTSGLCHGAVFVDDFKQVGVEPAQTDLWIGQREGHVGKFADEESYLGLEGIPGGQRHVMLSTDISEPLTGDLGAALHWDLGYLTVSSRRGQGGVVSIEYGGAHDLDLDLSEHGAIVLKFAGPATLDARVTVELISGSESAELSASTILRDIPMPDDPRLSNSPVMTFSAADFDGIDLEDVDRVRVSFWTPGSLKGAFSIDSILLVPTPGSLALGACSILIVLRRSGRMMK